MNYLKIAIIVMCVLIVAGLGGVIFKINQANGVLRASLGQANRQLAAVNEESEAQKNALSQAQNALTATQAGLKEVQGSLGEKDKLSADLIAELNNMKSSLASTTEANKSAEEKMVKFKNDLGLYNSSIYYTLTRLGVGATNSDLGKIPTADYNFAGYDGDGDGLSDAVERALGVNPAKADTDGDGFNDKAEIIGGFNPNGAGNLNFDNVFAGKQKGKILLQVQSKGEAWYVSFTDGKKYFLGLPSAAVKVLQSAGM